MRALDIAASGMAAQDLNVQVISNNIANMNTTGYKRQRAEFQDLLYEHVSRVGTQTSAQGNILPVGIDLGGGVKTVGTPRLITQGSLSQTGNTLDTTFQPCNRLRGEPEFRCVEPARYTVRLQGASCEVDVKDNRRDWKLVSKTCEYYPAM